VIKFGQLLPYFFEFKPDIQKKQESLEPFISVSKDLYLDEFNVKHCDIKYYDENSKKRIISTCSSWRTAIATKRKRSQFSVKVHSPGTHISIGFAFADENLDSSGQSFGFSHRGWGLYTSSCSQSQPEYAHESREHWHGYGSIPRAIPSEFAITPGCIITVKLWAESGMWFYKDGIRVGKHPAFNFTEEMKLSGLYPAVAIQGTEPKADVEFNYSMRI